MYNPGIINLPTFAFQNIGMYFLEPTQSYKLQLHASIQSWKGFSFPGKLQGFHNKLRKLRKYMGVLAGIV